jgi:hypothetical protein
MKKKSYTACVMSEIIRKFPNFTAEINALCRIKVTGLKCDVSLVFLLYSQYQLLYEDITVKYISWVSLPGVEPTTSARNRCLVRAPWSVVEVTSASSVYDSRVAIFLH